MNKSLEALNKICKVKIYQKEASAYDYLGKEIYKDEINTIKQDLERLEKLEKENQELLVNKNLAQAIALKYKKAVEILKEHNLTISYIPDISLPHLTLNDYGDGVTLTQEEFDLLKEVLS